MLTVIGVSGKAGSGKNTLVDYMKEVVQETYTNYVFELSFAAAVKNFGRTYFPDICDPIEKDPVSRKVLQGIGQMMRAEVSDNFWIDRTFDQVRIIQDTYPDKNIVVFIPDVRYLNEADSLYEQHSPEENIETYLIRINGRTSLSGKAAQHLSETDLDNYLAVFDEIYENDGSLEDLKAFGRNFVYETLYKGAN